MSVTSFIIFFWLPAWMGATWMFFILVCVKGVRECPEWIPCLQNVTSQYEYIWLYWIILLYIPPCEFFCWRVVYKYSFYTAFFNFKNNNEQDCLNLLTWSTTFSLGILYQWKYIYQNFSLCALKKWTKSTFDYSSFESTSRPAHASNESRHSFSLPGT